MNDRPISFARNAVRRVLRWLHDCQKKVLHSVRTRSDDYARSRVLYVRALGGVYLIATISWWVQAPALVGAEGLLPYRSMLDHARETLEKQNQGRWTSLPSLLWWGRGDVALHAVCAIGAAASALVFLGRLTGPALLFAWFCYLSLVNTGGVFMRFQWDILLLEAGALGVLFAPWRIAKLRLFDAPALSFSERCALWLQWLLVAKLMFQSGWVKLAWATSSQPEWWPDRTAMTYHYFTQPLPNPLSWWMHQAPAGFHVFSLWPMYAAELLCPLLVLLGTRARLLAAFGFSTLMVLILITGNYTYFNLLSIILCIPLIADRWWPLPRRRPERVTSEPSALRSDTPSTYRAPPRWAWRAVTPFWRLPAIVLLGWLSLMVIVRDLHHASKAVRDPLLPSTHLQNDYLPAWTTDLLHATQPYFIVNGYGLFRTMTTRRPEIIIEGSRDGIVWLEYALAWKPGPLDRVPPQVAPHQPRLAWQFWFAALEGRYHPQSWNAPWFSSLIVKLLKNDPSALTLFDEVPFPDDPPRYLRAQLYLYEFTTAEQRRDTGHWWTRSAAGMYIPIVSLQ